MAIPSEIHDLYAILKISFTLYEQGEHVQNTEAAYGLRDVADHLLIADRERDSLKAEREYQQAAEHLSVLAIDPLQRRTHERVVRINKVLERYRRHHLIHEMPKRLLIEELLQTVDTHIQSARLLKGRTDPAETWRCYEHIQSAYTTGKDVETLLENALQTFSVRLQLVLWLIAFLVGVAGLILGLIAFVR